jgi:hypothetical protein
MIPMFRQRFKGTWRATVFLSLLLACPARAGVQLGYVVR